MTHYPYRTDLSDEFGIAPYTDTSFLTLLAPNDVPGLSIRTQTGKWIDAPTIPGVSPLNGGQLRQRQRLFPAPHRAVNRSAVDGYALAFFCDAGIDWPIAGAPTRIRPDKPPKHPTTRHTECMIDYH
jgi:isopenicillin N synthase-like dioxygenase